MAEHPANEISILSFRTYQVRQMIDVQVAAIAVQQEEMFPNVDKLTRSHLSTIISELGTNIVKYAKSGRILLRSLEAPKKAGIEVIAVDDGPGIPDLEQALQDHYTTGKTLGLGLGAVRRLATDFELSCPETGGTKVLAICWWPTDGTKKPTAIRRSPPRQPRAQRVPPEIADQNHASPALPSLKLTSISRNRAALGQSQSGDALVLVDHGNLSVRIVLDGAGHGPIAHELSSQAASVIRQHLEQEIESIPVTDTGLTTLTCERIDNLMLETARNTHEQTRGSRGVAFGMAVFDRHARRVHYLGIGNTRILQLNWKGWEGVNRDGQLGVSYKRPVVNHYPLALGDLIIQSSDGIRSSSLRAMRAKRPDHALDPEQLIERLLGMTTFNDDVSILVTRCHD